MRAIFLPGPFAEADALGAILGAARPEIVPATLGDFALQAEPHGARVAMVPSPGGRVVGAVARASGETADRLAFALAAFGGAQAQWVDIGGRAVEIHAAAAAFAEPAAVAPEAEWRAHLVECVAEAMAHFGRRPADEIPALLQGISYRALGRVRGRAETRPVRARYGYGAADVETLAVARPYTRYFAIEEHRLRHRRFDGGVSGVVERAVFVSGDAVTVVPFDPVRRLVLLIEQFRVGPLARLDPHPWQIEAVAGRCDAGETPEATARREAREEAGIEIGRMTRIAAYYSSPGVMAEHITAFVGEADLADAGGVHGLDAEDEDIRALVVPVETALAFAASGEINNAPLLLSLFWLAPRLDALAAEWAA